MRLQDVMLVNDATFQQTLQNLEQLNVSFCLFERTYFHDLSFVCFGPFGCTFLFGLFVEYSLK